LPLEGVKAMNTSGLQRNRYSYRHSLLVQLSE